MARKQLTLKTGQGINRDQLSKELAPGVWSDCQNMRFRNGCDERVGGVASVFTTPAVTPYWLSTFGAGTTTSIARFLFQAGLTKCYVDDGTTQTEVTRYTNIVITALSRDGAGTGSATTQSNHGLSIGNSFTIWNAFNTAFNGTYTVATVPSATQVTFTLAGSALSGSGFVGVMQINTTVNFTGASTDKWTGGTFNGVLLANSPVDGLYYWSGDTTIRMRRLYANTPVGLPYTFVCDVARPYKNFIVMFGARTSTSATKLPYRINWTASVDPGSVPSTSQFAAAASNDAGSVDKAETPGALVDMLPYGDSMIVYKEDSRIEMHYIGGNDVFAFQYLPGNDGLLAINCVVNTPKGQVFFTQNFDVKIHQGGQAESLAEGRIKQWIRDNIDSTNYKASFLAVNNKYSEVWVCIPTTGNSTCNKALLWNWNDDTWGERDITGVTCAASGMLPSSIATEERLVIGTTGPKIGLTDSGTTYLGSSITSMVERTGMDMDDPSTVKILQGSRWQDNGTAGATYSVYHGSAMTADATPTYSSAATGTLGTDDFVYSIANGGRFLALKRTTTAEVGKCRSVDLDLSLGGTK
jgi:hypothetical protein